GHDAILLGAVGGRPGDPRLPAGILERGLLLRLRFELDHYVNLRPSRIYPGVPSPLADPGDVDLVVVREGTEGPYTGNGVRLRAGHRPSVSRRPDCHHPLRRTPPGPSRSPGRRPSSRPSRDGRPRRAGTRRHPAYVGDRRRDRRPGGVTPPDAARRTKSRRVG